MIEPAPLTKEALPTIIGYAFGSPVVVEGWTGLPLLEIGSWGILTWAAAAKHPEWSTARKIFAGALTTAILFGLEWCHDLAHAAFAWKVGKPTDAIRIYFGNPRLVYHDVNDLTVTPAQHMRRASGGPLLNALLVPFAWLARKLTRDGSLPRYAADFALGTNLVLSAVALLPIPAVDGGALLKWSIVSRGRTTAEADESVRKANLAVGSGLGIASVVAARKKRKWLAAAAGALSIASFIIGLGLLKEQK